MSFQDNFSAFALNLQSFGDKVLANVTSTFNKDVVPFAQRTQLFVQDKLGGGADVSELPQEYVDLEAKVDALKNVYQLLLTVTATYELESYDYPAHTKEQLTLNLQTVQQKLARLSNATNLQDAQQILVAPGNAAPPQTLGHALARATASGASSVATVSGTPDEFSKALLEVLEAAGKAADARLAQDKQIATHFNAPLRDALRVQFQQAADARRDVQVKRAAYDSVRLQLRSASADKEALLRVKLETLEDEFANATEDAVSVMKHVLESGSAAKQLGELVRAIKVYHEQAAAAWGAALTGDFSV